MCLLVDASGSMSGERLAVAATVTAAACPLRAPAQHAVLAFARRAVVIEPLGGSRDPSLVVGDVLALRGHGVTRCAARSRRRRPQLAVSRAARRVTVLLSDCRPTDEVDAVPAARALDELVILAPRDDADEARHLARESGAQVGEVTGVDVVPALLEKMLSTR